MKTSVFDMSGKKTTTVDLAAEVFEAEVKPQLLAQAVRVHLINQRQGTKKAKTRGDVAGSGKKIWRQKGTGNARHGDRYAPIFVGGGVAHGPTGRENYRKFLPKKMRQSALIMALTQKAQDHEVVVIDGLEKMQPKTKLMQTLLQKTANYRPGKKLTLILENNEEGVKRAAGNLSGVRRLTLNQLNPYEILDGGILVLSTASLKALKPILLK